MSSCDTALIIDADQAHAQYIREILEKHEIACELGDDLAGRYDALLNNQYDILIVEPYNGSMDHFPIIEKLANQIPTLPIIIVTGQPTLVSAIQSVNLSIIAYLIKPLDAEKLQLYTVQALERSKTKHIALQIENQVNDLLSRLSPTSSANHETMHQITPEYYQLLAMRNILSSLADLHALSAHVSNNGSIPKHVCNMLDCPRLNQLTETLRNTTKVLRKTKSAFKSKELGELRKQLEQVLKIA